MVNNHTFVGFRGAIAPPEQHLQIVQINYEYFHANTHNRLVVSN